MYSVPQHRQTTRLWLYCDNPMALCPSLPGLPMDSHSGHGTLWHTNNPSLFAVGVPVDGLRKMGHKWLQIRLSKENSPVIASLTVLSPILNGSLSMLENTRTSNPSPIPQIVSWIAHSQTNCSMSSFVVHSPLLLPGALAKAVFASCFRQHFSQ